VVAMGHVIAEVYRPFLEKNLLEQLEKTNEMKKPLIIDNILWHTAKLVTEYFGKSHLSVLPLLPRNPDLTSIDYF
jgi:hypothetical protein